MKEVIINCETGEQSEIELTSAQVNERQNGHLALLWASLRTKRDRLLAESDWTVMSDTPANTAAWKTYRQALRDLPANTTDPHDPVWPTPPA